jgi:hypothetical protein
MARYAILNSLDWSACGELAAGRVSEAEAASRLSGCTWLFRVEPRVGDVEEAARDAVQDFYRSAEGRRARQDEGSERLGWEEALAWVPDEVWARHGLEPVRHPEVERVLVDAAEDLGAELSSR